MTKPKNENEMKVEAAITGNSSMEIEKKVAKPKKKKKKLSVITKRRVELGQFEVRVSDAKITIETMAKNWSISYAEGTTPYFIIKNLITNKSLDSLRTLILALYSTSIFFIDANTVMSFIKIVHEFKGSGTEPLSEEEDQEVLEEEKLTYNAKDATEEDAVTKKEDEEDDTLA